MFSPRMNTARRSSGLLVCLFLIASVLPTIVRGADPVRDTTSLKFIPGGVAFYGTLLRNGEQWNIFTKSKAYAKLMSMPAMQLATAQLGVLWDDPGNEFKQFLADPENKELLGLAADAVSNEIFIYGDSGYADLLELFNGINRVTNSAQLEASREGEEPAKVMAKRLAEYLDKNAAKLKVPDTVIGFKVSNPKSAQNQLARLEKALTEALDDQPDLKMRLKREKIAGTDFLSFHVDGGLVPWDEIPLDEIELDPEVFEKLIGKLKKLTVVISLGVRENYVILSIGDTSEHLSVLGKGKLLVDRPEMAPLLKAGDKRFTSIDYISEEFTQKAAAGQTGQFDDLVNMAKQFLPLSEIDEDLQKELIADAEALSADLKKLVPKPGSSMSYTYLTPRGYEGFAYDTGEHKGVDASKPLTILDHVGGDPILFVAGRGKSSPDEMQMLAKWSQRAIYYFEQIGLSELDEEQREQYKKIRKEAEPLLKRLGKAVTDMLMPALADGQSALVLEAKATSAKWHEAMPPSARPLPMLELAIVHGVSDAELLKKAFGEFFAIAQETADKLHKALPDEVPEFKIPGPKTKAVAGGTMYFYDIPEEAGLDKQILPNAGLSKAFAVLSYSPAQTARLLGTSQLPKTGPLARRQGPLASAVSFNFPAFVDALAPWIDYGFEVYQGLQTDAQAIDLLQDDASMKFVKEQITIALDVLKCFRGITSVSYLEGKVMVTHTEWQFQDLK